MTLDAGARAPAHLVRPFVDGRCRRAGAAEHDLIAVRIENGIAHVIKGGGEREAGPAQRAEGSDVAKREPTGDIAERIRIDHRTESAPQRARPSQPLAERCADRSVEIGDRRIAHRGWADGGLSAALVRGLKVEFDAGEPRTPDEVV